MLFDKNKSIFLDQNPLFSIITVVYNADNCLEETIKSVINQNYKNIEYIIIDGGSTDNTLSIIKKYEKQIKVWISEPDNGIYEAMNKGISLCQGEIVGIINAGDTYTSNAISRIVESYQNQSYPSIVVGDCKEFQSFDTQNWLIVSGRLNKLPYKMLPHPSVFVPLSIYKEMGVFNTDFKIAADYEFLCRCYKRSVPFIYVNQIIAIASPRGVSSNYYLTEVEYFKARINNDIPVILSVMNTCWSLVKITVHYLLDYFYIWHFVESWRHGSYR
ncbi:glycosyltransferase [Laspinema sp. A4]|uniref:glycosyltransferase family 2 protein n=1 Tax=Laspinema sp. D2d TaxID=2953686 RepID=UPI0021BB59DC|nr:glycosyltransferase family 2 protein [Laspinema sp. D2d]MCT7983619.1 glycosyltransferase [Laspinema sp. D2d]